MGIMRFPYKMLFGPVPQFRMHQETTALLLVDFQHFTTTRTCGLGRIANERGIDRELDEYYDQVVVALQNARRLVVACREHDIHVIHTLLASGPGSNGTRQMRAAEWSLPSGDLMAEIRSEVAPAPGEIILPRETFSPFASTPLMDILRQKKIDNLLIAGVMADTTIWTIAREAADRDFGVVLVIDACASQSFEWHSLLRDGIVGGLIRQRTTTQVIEMMRGERS